jgi:hypothetical protein
VKTLLYNLCAEVGVFPFRRAVLIHAAVTLPRELVRSTLGRTAAEALRRPKPRVPPLQPVTGLRRFPLWWSPPPDDAVFGATGVSSPRGAVFVALYVEAGE